MGFVKCTFENYYLSNLTKSFALIIYQLTNVPIPGKNVQHTDKERGQFSHFKTGLT